ncbi:MAG: 1-deoxy-D-xylulose-5-phosphate reductoisomerase, partial [Lachnospiraceae bacterium]|nr:1-deoxy-D-xylulose-5-phosphate reductoisomerase [Lachnospiraceae bacterium]
GYRAGRTGGSLPAVFNAANEQAVRLFASGKIGFTEIYEMIEYCMDEHKLIDNPSLEQIFESEEETCERIKGRWG